MFQIRLNQIERIEYKIAVKNGKTYLCKWSKYLQIQNRKKNPVYTAMLKPIDKCPYIKCLIDSKLLSNSLLVLQVHVIFGTLYILKK